MTNTTLGQRICEARSRIDVDRFELAHHIQVEESLLNQFETDQVTPDKESIRLIAAITGVSSEWLTTGEGDMIIGPDKPSDNPIIQQLDDCIKAQARLGAKQRRIQAIRVAETCSTLTKALLEQIRHKTAKPDGPITNPDEPDFGITAAGCDVILQTFTLLRQNGLSCTDVIMRITDAYAEQQ